MVNEETIDLPGYILHHLCEDITNSKKHKKNNIPYARLLSELFHSGYLIDSLKVAFTHDDMEEIHGNLLSALVLANMKLLKKNEVVLSKDPLRVRSSKSTYLKDNPIITKHDNLEATMMYIDMARK